MRLLYTYNFAPRFGGKYLKEGRECLEAMLKECPEEMRMLWQFYLKGVAFDTRNSELLYNGAKADETLQSMPDDPVCNIAGPR